MTLISFTTAARDNDARTPGALARILKFKKLPRPFACAEQVHGSHISIIPSLLEAKKYEQADGLLTDAYHQPLAIFTADCVPVFLSAGAGKVVGMLHAGWRGIQKGILPKAIRLLGRKWHLKPSQIMAWAGPSIGPCCFEVQWDVAKHFPSTRRRLNSRWTVDLEGELRRQARRLGVRWVSKKSFEGCTMHGKRYFSFRRNKTNKRQVSVIIKL